VFVRATRADGDALSVREALGLGSRVVASDVGHRPPGCLLFRSGDAGDLAERMVEITRLPRAAVRSGRPPAERDPFEALLAVYRSVAGDAHRANGASSPPERFRMDG
jgi:glycogen(starch) synthase